MVASPNKTRSISSASVAPGISEALIATAMGLFAAIPAVWAYNRFATKVERIAGRYDAFWERSLSSWDVAAGIVLVREAGGIVSDLASGQDMLTNGHILASNGNLHRPMLKTLKGASA